MANHTWEDFLGAYKAGGWNESNFSAEDYALAQQDPDAGWDILIAKSDYQRATTPEARALAHQQAETARKNAGNYSGGTDGMQHNQYETEATQTDSGTSSGTSSFPANTDPSSVDIGAVLADSYNQWLSKNGTSNNGASVLPSASGTEETTTTDNTTSSGTTYQQVENMWPYYQQQYEREGAKAAEDTMGIAAAMTGGIPSSYAVSAGQQSYNDYMSALMDLYPELAQAGLVGNGYYDADGNVVLYNPASVNAESTSTDTSGTDAGTSGGTTTTNANQALLDAYNAAQASTQKASNGNSTATSTYSDFEKAYKEYLASGYSELSEADLALAQVDPAAGIALINARTGFATAQSKEERDAYRSEAEKIRNSYGYSGGSDGNSPYALDDANVTGDETPTTDTKVTQATQNNGASALPTPASSSATVENLPGNTEKATPVKVPSSIEAPKVETMSAAAQKAMADPTVQSYLSAGGTVTLAQWKALAAIYGDEALNEAGLTLK